MNEFQLINKYFAARARKRPDVLVGIGDDAAIVQVPAANNLVVTADTLVSGVHFLETTSPSELGHKCLAINLSDLAAMGAAPAWVTLALTLHHLDEEWLNEFSRGFLALADRYNVSLIGGDITHGPLSITVQALGLVSSEQASKRNSAQIDDLIYVTGTMGDAGLALKWLQKKIAIHPSFQPFLLQRLHHPEPKVDAGIALRGLVNAAIDISDGLAADLAHILEQSSVGAKINVDAIPLSSALKNTLPHKEAIALALTAGDDYELCFTVPKNNCTEFERVLTALTCSYTCIGVITAQKDMELTHKDGSKYHGPILGYQHFQ